LSIAWRKKPKTQVHAGCVARCFDTNRLHATKAAEWAFDDEKNLGHLQGMYLGRAHCLTS